MVTLAAAVEQFVTFFVLAHGIGTVPVFVSLTQGMTPERRADVLRRAAFAGTGLLVACCLAGEGALRFFGVSDAGLRAGGGLVLLLSALGMVRGGAHEGGEHAEDPAIVPLAIPLYVGPALIAAVILAANRAGDVVETAALVGLIALNGFVWWLLLRASAWFAARLGKAGLDLVSRVMGLILCALAAEMIAEGVRVLMGR